MFLDKIFSMLKIFKNKITEWKQFKKDLKQTNKTKYLIYESIETILVALTLALIITRFIIQVSVVPTGSMIPTMIGGVEGHPNERLIVNKFIYKFKTPKRGNIVVFKSPHKDNKDWVKRCIGEPGEIIEIRKGVVFVNNKELVLVGVDVQRDRSDFGPVKVPVDSFFMLGDNRSASQDSRYFGFVRKSDLVGQSLFTIWPLNRMRWLR